MPPPHAIRSSIKLPTALATKLAIARTITTASKQIEVTTRGRVRLTRVHDIAGSTEEKESSEMRTGTSRKPTQLQTNVEHDLECGIIYQARTSENKKEEREVTDLAQGLAEKEHKETRQSKGNAWLASRNQMIVSEISTTRVLDKASHRHVHQHGKKRYGELMLAAVHVAIWCFGSF